MKSVAAALATALNGSTNLPDLEQNRDRLANSPIYPRSATALDTSALMLARDRDEKFLVEAATARTDLCGSFVGAVEEIDGLVLKRCELSRDNAQALRARLPWAAPISLRQRRTTVGCGDRLGRATAGHLRVMRDYDVAPVLAQQSIRELTLTGRAIDDVVDDTCIMVFQEGYRDGYGADGDHLKTMKDIDVAVDAGMAMITLDLTEVMNPAPETWEADRISTAYAALPADEQARLTATYADQRFTVGQAEVLISAVETQRCALMYGEAIRFAATVYEHLRRRRGDEFDLELSIDETTAPTLPAHHLFIIRELLRLQVELTSLAPRFIGEFQKGIDYIGDLDEFEEQFRIHCQIAQNHGDYKISVHSGSDKFSAFPIVGKHTRGRFHLKTAGTSWLEAVRVITHRDPKLYRDLHRSAENGYADALKLYHITADFGNIAALDGVSDAELPAYLEQDEARQLLHISYGTILNDPHVRPRFFAALHQYENDYYECLQRHFARHLDLLGVPKKA